MIKDRLWRRLLWPTIKSKSGKIVNIAKPKTSFLSRLGLKESKMSIGRITCSIGSTMCFLG